LYLNVTKTDQLDELLSACHLVIVMFNYCITLIL